MPHSSTFCNSYTITNEINERILARNLAYGNLDILLDTRPLPTKYVKPNAVINPPCTTKVLHYNTTPVFNPGNKKGAWSGYVTNVHTECLLRNQIYALQKFPQADYVPNSNSSLYISQIPDSGNTVEAIYPHLFDNNIIHSTSSQTKSNTPYLGNLFNNDTRQQLKDS
jgi:hypothetical protein